jgi:hypothetical protein
MPLGIVWLFTVVVPDETITLPRLAVMAAAPVYCTDPSGPSWKSPDRVSNWKVVRARQILDPGMFANVPAGHVKQLLGFEMPVLELNVPIGHGRHGSTAPVLYVPAGQSEHDPALVPEQPVRV